MPEKENGVTVYKLFQLLLKQYRMSEIDKAYCLVAACPHKRQDMGCEGPRICMLRQMNETQAIKTLWEVKKYLKGKKVLFTERRKR